jgi:hypothetical protein
MRDIFGALPRRAANPGGPTHPACISFMTSAAAFFAKTGAALLA